MESTRRDTVDGASLQVCLEARVRTCGYASMQACMTACDSHCVMSRYDVAVWKSALDLILQEVAMSAVPRHQGHGAHA